MKKITTLIPAYKTEYLGELFYALRHQTYKNFQVIVSDDSPGGKVSELLQTQPYLDLMAGMQVELVQGPRTGGLHNVLHLTKLGRGRSELLHMLFDDDIIYPRFYEYHAGIHQTPEVMCSVSKRWTATAQGMPVGMLTVPIYVEHNMNRAFVLDWQRLFQSTVPHCTNWLGEYSNCVFSQEMIPIVLNPELGGISYFGLEDIGMLLKASLADKKVIFIQDHLGYFRINPFQNTGQKDNPAIKAGILCFCALATAAVKLGKLTKAEAYQSFQHTQVILQNMYPQDEIMKKFVALFSGYSELTDDLMQKFVAAWQEFLKSHNFAQGLSPD